MIRTTIEPALVPALAPAIALGLAIALAVSTGPRAARAQQAVANDYPTSTRADYVLGCMAANGQTRVGRPASPGTSEPIS